MYNDKNIYLFPNNGSIYTSYQFADPFLPEKEDDYGNKMTDYEFEKFQQSLNKENTTYKETYPDIHSKTGDLKLTCSDDKSPIYAINIANKDLLERIGESIITYEEKRVFKVDILKIEESQTTFKIGRYIRNHQFKANYSYEMQLDWIDRAESFKDWQRKHMNDKKENV